MTVLSVSPHKLFFILTTNQLHLGTLMCVCARACVCVLAPVCTFVHVHRWRNGNNVDSTECDVRYDAFSVCKCVSVCVCAHVRLFMQVLSECRSHIHNRVLLPLWKVLPPSEAPLGVESGATPTFIRVQSRRLHLLQLILQNRPRFLLFRALHFRHRIAQPM